MELSPFCYEIYRQNYQFGDETLAETRHRVAVALARPESDPTLWTERFEALLQDFKFVPGGRILANAGTNLTKVGLLNCFVSGPTEPDCDSLDGIHAELGRQIKVLASEGGYGFCADFMRPQGAYIQGIGIESPGPLKFLDLFDRSSEVITAGSGREVVRSGGKKRCRKGAQMVTLSVWHPDIMEFIVAKQQPGRLTKFNMSVLVTDEFMTAVKHHQPWNLEYPDYEKNMEKYQQVWRGFLSDWKARGLPCKTYKQLADANELWDLITTSTYHRNEPGVIFIDRVNQLNNLAYCEKINATNPCLTGDTLITTIHGTHSISKLIGMPFIISFDGKAYQSTDRGFWSTGIKPVYRLSYCGSSIKATSNHRFLTLINGVECWQSVESLRPGVYLLIPGGTIRLDAIEPAGEEEVFDCCVPYVHAFIANGLISHNCGEEPLPANGVCLLGSFNLTQYLMAGGFDLAKLGADIPVAVRLLDNVNDVTITPLPAQKQNLRDKRRIGLGFMGYASALMILQIRYGSERALSITKELLEFYVNRVYQASAELAGEKGMFPLFRDPYLQSEYLSRLNEQTRTMVEHYGLRNSHLLSIQPTGTSSIFANNVSGGIEPIFALEYCRRTIWPTPCGLVLPEGIDWINRKSHDPWMWQREGDEWILTCEFDGQRYYFDRSRGLTRETVLRDYAYTGQSGEWVVTSRDLDIDDHLRTLDLFAYYIDSGISKTINVPHDYPYESFKSVYLRAYEMGNIKGLTTYREGTMLSVLKPIDNKKELPLERPEVLDCDISLVQSDGDKWLVLIGLWEGKPYEVFALKPKHFSLSDKVKTGQLRKIKGETNRYDLVTEFFTIEDLGVHFVSDEHQEMTRFISLSLRSGANVDRVYQQLNRLGGTVVSFNRAIARSLAKYVKRVELPNCPQCGKNEGLSFVEGCVKCVCGYSKCS